MQDQRYSGKAIGRKIPPQTKNAAFEKKAPHIAYSNGIRAGFTCQFDRWVDRLVDRLVDLGGDQQTSRSVDRTALKLAT